MASSSRESRHKSSKTTFGSKKTKQRNKKKQRYGPEAEIQISFNEYIKNKYPNILKSADHAGTCASSKMEGMKTKLMGHERGKPDFVIYHTTKKIKDKKTLNFFNYFLSDNSKLNINKPKKFNTLHIEFKANEKSKISEHQLNWLYNLNLNGRLAVRINNYDDAVLLLNKYMENAIVPKNMKFIK